MKNTIVTITGGTIYGSVFGGGEDGHVMADVKMTISGGTIGTWGTSYVDGNIFGGGRGFTGDAYTAGNVAGSVAMNITGGTMLGSIYGGGRLGSVGYGLYMEKEKGYGEMRDDDKMDDGTAAPEGWFLNGRGHVVINISGGTIGNDWEYKHVPSDITTEGLAAWQATNKVPKTAYESTDNGDGTYTHRLSHTKGGNVYAGGMGRREKLQGTVIDYPGINWLHLGNVKSTKVNISGGHIKSNVYGGGEFGAVRGHRMVGSEALSTDINITGGTIGTEIVDETAEGETKPVMYTFGSVYGGGTGTTVDVTRNTPIAKVDTLSAYVTDSTKVTVEDAIVRASVYGGGELSAVGGSTHVTISGSAAIGRNEVRPATDANAGYVKFGGWRMGNVYGGGRGSEEATIAGLVKGNTNVTISGGSVYHNVYGGGALGSVGTFSLSDGAGAPAYIPVAGVPYGWTAGTGTATVTITGGTIGISGRDNGLVFGSSRGDLSKPAGTPAIDTYDYLAWVDRSVVTIGTSGSGSTLDTPLIKGSVYGGGENGHNDASATVNVYSGTIGVTATDDPWYAFTDKNLEKRVQMYRGNVYGAGSGSDTYTGDDGKEHYNPKSGMVGGNTFVNIAGGHVGHSVYGGGAMASVGTIKNAADTTTTAKHVDETTSFALSWPYRFEFADNTGKATVNITGGHIGTRQLDGGDVYGSSRGEAGDRYETAHLAFVRETEVNVNYATTEEMPDMATIQDNFTKQCISGSVHGSGEDGYVYGDTRVTLNKGLIGHSLYGAGKGKGTYEVTLRKVGGAEGDTYKTDIYSLISGKVFGNTYVTMNDGHVGRNVYGGGNMASVGKGNYASGADDYYPAGYGEKIEGNLWTTTATSAADADDAWEFLNSGKATVKVFGGTVGYVDADPTKSIKNYLPYGNVFGGSAGESAPNVDKNLRPRYHYCPTFFAGYVNETDVNIGGYRCKTAYGEGNGAHTVGEMITAAEYELLSDEDKVNWEKAAGPTIIASVYGGGQDGHVRRDTRVTVTSGVIGMAFNDENREKLKTNILATTKEEINHDQWLHRGNVYGAGSGISKYTSSLVYKEDTPEAEQVPKTGYSTSAGSVTRSTSVDIKGGTIYRNVYGGGSMASVGAPRLMGYDMYLPTDPAHLNEKGKQSLNEVIVGGGKDAGKTVRVSIGDADGHALGYGGNVFGGSRGDASVDKGANRFATAIWTKVFIKDGANIFGNVFGGGDAGAVKKDTDVQIGEKAATTTPSTPSTPSTP